MSITFFPGTEVVARGFRWDRAGAATKADAWQVPSSGRATMHGVDALNRMIQERRRHVWYQEATKQNFRFREVIVRGERQFLENGLIHRTERGEVVRSSPSS